MPDGRPLRADAARNRAKILEAANRQIIARGPEVPMEAIAEDAGVAVGTLYRHFPTKDDLVTAVLHAHFESMVAAAEAAADRIEAGAPAIDEFAGFFRFVLELAAGNMAVKAAARALGADWEEDLLRGRGLQALERIVAAGIDRGDLRPDMTLDDCFLFFATAPIDQPAPVRERWFTLMLDGCRADTARRTG
jgi:AcrR family transcriptional regulator